MDGEPKKISFGFSKQLKKPALKPVEEKKQFIECLEEKSIKVKGGEIVEERKPLVIPLKDKDRTVTAAALARIAKEVEQDETANTNSPVASKDEKPTEIGVVKKESLDAMAAREILEDLKKEKTTQSNLSLVVPIKDNVKLTGEKESTLEDYENIPVSDFGMAMLRGMGWKEGAGIGKSTKSVELALPKLRPKGMGLGADKVPAISKNEKQNGIAGEEEIKITKGAYVKIIAGKQGGTYGQISGFDEDSGRLIVKAAIGGANINLSEFMVQAITKDEYQKQSKVINAAKYEEYKMKESKVSQKHEKYEEITTEREKYKENRSESRTTTATYKSESREWKRESDKYSSSHSSRRDEYRDKYNGNKDTEKRRDKYSERRSSSSSSSEPKRERNSDKKRKGKKKRRDRSRSRDHRRR